MPWSSLKFGIMDLSRMQRGHQRANGGILLQMMDLHGGKVVEKEMHGGKVVEKEPQAPHMMEPIVGRATEDEDN